MRAPVEAIWIRPACLAVAAVTDGRVVVETQAQAAPAGREAAVLRAARLRPEPLTIQKRGATVGRPAAVV